MELLLTFGSGMRKNLSNVLILGQTDWSLLSWDSYTILKNVKATLDARWAVLFSDISKMRFVWIFILLCFHRTVKSEHILRIYKSNKNTLPLACLQLKNCCANFFVYRTRGTNFWIGYCELKLNWFFVSNNSKS